MYVKKLKKQVNISLESPCIVRCGVGISIHHSSQDFFYLELGNGYLKM